MPAENKLTHLDESGAARMVDVADKPVTHRIAVANGFVEMAPATLELIVSGKAPGTTVWITHSDDDGTTWTAPREISTTARKAFWGWYGTGPGAGLYLRGGSRPDRLLIPS